MEKNIEDIKETSIQNQSPVFQDYEKISFWEKGNLVNSDLKIHIDSEQLQSIKMKELMVHQW